MGASRRAPSPCNDQLRAAAKVLPGPERIAGSNEAATDKGRVTAKPASYTLTSTAAKTLPSCGEVLEWPNRAAC